MSNNKNKSDMLKELAIFEYVAGDQSSETRINFEKMMAADPELRAAVEAEIALRDALQETDSAAPVAMENFDALVARIDAIEESPIVDKQADKQVEEREQNLNSSGNVVAVPFWRKPYAAMAASVALVAVLAAGFLQNLNAPEYITLSDQQASDQIDVPQAMYENRLLRVDLVSSLGTSEIEQLLAKYELQMVNHSPRNSSIIVVAGSKSVEEQLRALSADPRIANATAVAIDNEE